MDEYSSEIEAEQDKEPAKSFRAQGGWGFGIGVSD